jgi:hypothetical protein
LLDVLIAPVAGWNLRFSGGRARCASLDGIQPGLPESPRRPRYARLGTSHINGQLQLLLSTPAAAGTCPPVASLPFTGERWEIQ